MAEREFTRETHQIKNQQDLGAIKHPKSTTSSSYSQSEACVVSNEVQRYTDKKFIPTMDRSSNLERDAPPEDDSNVWRAVNKPNDQEHRNLPYGYEAEDHSWDDSVRQWEPKSVNTERIEGEADPLAELRMVASIEAKALQEYPTMKEEVYYGPPTPVKRRNTEIKEIRATKRRSRAIKTEKEASESSVVEVESNGFKSFNDFDEDIFKFDQAAKMYKCPQEDCDKAFPSLSRIKRHYIIHTNIKPFRCLNPGCIRRFSRKDNMLQHCRVHCQHGGDGEIHK